MTHIQSIPHIITFIVIFHVIFRDHKLKKAMEEEGKAKKNIKDNKKRDKRIVNSSNNKNNIDKTKHKVKKIERS